MLIDDVYIRETPMLYTRYRDEEGNLVEGRHQGYLPYFWIPKDTPLYRFNRLQRQYPTAMVRHDREAEALDGTPLIMVEAETPKDIIRMRDMFDRTYEADVRFTDRWLMDNVDEMPKWKPRKWWYDIEADPKGDFTTVIAIVDSDMPDPVVFAWGDERTNIWDGVPNTGHNIRTVRGIKYDLYVYESEHELHEAFLEFLDERNPDMLIAHGGTFFDLPHLIRRLRNPERLSPVGQVRHPKRGEKHYDHTAQPIIGRWQFDTAAPAMSGTGFERVWKDSGGGQLPSRKLNDIAETLGLGSKLTEEIEGMDVFNGWYKYWSEFVDYCLLDATLLRDIDEARNVTDFYIEMVRLCGVSMTSACNVTNFARGLLTRRTDKKAPTRYRADEGKKLKGAEVGLNCVTGLHSGVGILDYKGLYPSIILGSNISYETKRDGPGEGIMQLENGSYWDQREKGLLPQVVEYLFEYRAECKQRMKDAETSEERQAWNTTQMAVKRVMASLYGMTAHAGYGWADPDIAHTITSEGRRCIRLLDSVATKAGYKCLYGHTDSAFVQVPSVEEAEVLAEKVTKAVQSATGNKMLFAELEAWMPYWLLVKKNRYVGKLAWPPEDEGKLKVAGFEMKASNAAPISKRLQKAVFNMVCDGIGEKDVSEVVLETARSVQNGEIDLKEVSLTTRLGMNLHEYKVLSGGSRAATYYNENLSIGEPFSKGDSVKWTYVSSVPNEMPLTEVVGFREANEISEFQLDSKTILNKMVKSKLDSVYDTLGWDLDGALGAPRPKAYEWW